MSSTGTRKVLRERIIEVAADQDGDVPAAYFELYGEEMADAGALLANQRIVSHFFSRVAHKRNVVGLKWMKEFLTANSGFLKKVPAEHTVQDFEKRIEEYITDRQADDAQVLIDEIAEMLGIHPVEVSAPSADEGTEEQESGEV
jgi:hypothetical protein